MSLARNYRAYGVELLQNMQHILARNGADFCHKSKLIYPILTFVALLEMTVMSCVIYATLTAYCWKETALLLATKTRYMFYSLVIESGLQAMLLFIYWLNICMKSRRGILLCEIMICTVSFVCLMNIPLAGLTARTIAEGSVKKTMSEAIEPFEPHYDLTKETYNIENAWQCCDVFTWDNWGRNPYVSGSYSLSTSCSKTPFYAHQYKILKLGVNCSNFILQQNLTNLDVSMDLMDDLFLRDCIYLIETSKYISAVTLAAYSFLVCIIPLVILALHQFMKSIIPHKSEENTSETQIELSHVITLRVAAMRENN